MVALAFVLLSPVLGKHLLASIYTFNISSQCLPIASLCTLHLGDLQFTQSIEHLSYLILYQVVVYTY